MGVKNTKMAKIRENVANEMLYLIDINIISLM